LFVHFVSEKVSGEEKIPHDLRPELHKLELIRQANPGQEKIHDDECLFLLIKFYSFPVSGVARVIEKAQHIAFLYFQITQVAFQDLENNRFEIVDRNYRQRDRAQNSDYGKNYESSPIH